MSEAAVTKKVIADGFRYVMEKKSFDKITISDITDKCGLNRQTFYYHFQDKYELLNWILYTDVVVPFTENLSIDNWSDKLLNMLNTLKDNHKFYVNALNTAHGDEFKKYFLDAVTDVICEIIDRITEGQSIDPDDRQFIAGFFAYGITGTVSRWVMTGMKRSPEATAVYIKNLVNDFKGFALKRYISTELINID